jgi:ribosome-associated protein
MPTEFILSGPYIELDNLLKTLGWVEHGAAAKVAIREGKVRVNAEVESRVRRKLKAGDRVVFEGQEVEIRGT